MTPHADAARRRVTPAQRLDEVVDAATRVFAAKGYRRTQMSDVARALGVSAGNLYNYVPGKETLFALVLRRGAEGTAAPAAVSLPVAPITLDEAVASLTERLDFVGDFPALEAALADEAPASASAAAAEARAVVLELYDQLDRIGRLIVVIEASGPDVPEVATFFLGLRREAFARMARYVESRTRAGAFRPLEDPAVTARLIFELAHWSAVRHPHRNDPESLPADAARRAVADIAVSALVGT